jgi:hypothetical protein
MIARKGFSPVIGVLALMLLSVVAISLLWTYTAIITEERGREIDTQGTALVDCILDRTKITATYDETQGSIKVNFASLDTQRDFKEVNFYVSFEDDASENFRCGGEACTSCSLNTNSNTKEAFLVIGNGKSPQTLTVSTINCEDKQILIALQFA